MDTPAREAEIPNAMRREEVAILGLGYVGSLWLLPSQTLGYELTA